MASDAKSHLDRPLPATPASPHRVSTSFPVGKGLNISKTRDRTRLKKKGTRESVQETTTAFPQSEADEHTSRALVVSRTSSPSLPNSRPSIDSTLRETLQSRWSTSTSDVASGVFLRKESKRKIFGIPISFKRRVKSELPPSLHTGSGFFGSRFGASKLSLALGSPKANINSPTSEQQWKSSRASSSMTVRGMDGTASDDDTRFEHSFPALYEEGELTLRSRVPQRRHTMTGNILGVYGSPLRGHVGPPTLSRHSSIRSPSRSPSGVEKRSSVKGLLSLFPRPPKRETSGLMEMLNGNNTMPLIFEAPEHHPSEYASGADGHISPNNLNESKGLFLGLEENKGYKIPPTNRVSTMVPFPTPKNIVYTGAHKKPILTHLDLQVVAETDTIDIGQTRDIWAVIELNGSLSNNRELINSASSGLDVVFLLDLSQNMSEQSVTTMKTTLGYLIENLSGNLSDNFGMAGFTSTSACEVLMPLIPCTHQAKHRAFTLLSKLAATSDAFLVDTPISNVVRAACSMFMPCVYGKNKNLIILSSAVPSHQHNMVDVSGFEDVKVHVIGVGSIYWPVSDVTYADTRDGGGGFCFTAAMMDIKNSAEDENHKIKLQAVTRRFLRAVRSKNSIGIIRDVEISITPGMNVTIEAMMGKTRINTLRPGERATIIVRMAVTSLLRGNHIERGEMVESIEDELYASLGMERMKLLTVKVEHRHSLFPDTTVLTTSASASVVIVAKDTLWSGIRSTYDDEWGMPIFLPSPRRNFARKALLQKIAMENTNPKDALIAVERTTRATEEKDLDYFDVVRELKYQIRVWNSRRRGRVMTFSGGNGAGETIHFHGKVSEEDMDRPFSFEGKQEKILAVAHEERIPTPDLTNDSDSVDESFGSLGADLSGGNENSTGSVVRYIDTDGAVEGSPVTAINETVRRVSEPRLPDSASRLWKRIEKAGEVGSIGESSTIADDTLANEYGGSITGESAADTGEKNGQGKKGKKKKKAKGKKGVGSATTMEYEASAESDNGTY
ncbi:hypothetical protein H072_447 [Dactylellina haptotyla CBS 200.50]|uniref:VWFA domain-containing protein n=1 Tax=Dactylellina haptotyla (strain CBS 200.50) TaxID=1284197 RepID=S8C192_DACHA|nr:hypothetical protein H072_447 [Dactylellina haptotyla CBS 200.50]